YSPSGESITCSKHIYLKVPHLLQMFETHLWEYNHWEIMEYQQHFELQQYLGSQQYLELQQYLRSQQHLVEYYLEQYFE
ncbi:hypothetical protein Tco_0479804, partial [Tanacetum coccineum]